MGENRLDKAKSLVILLLAMIMLTACISSNNDKVLVQEESLKRKLTIELVARTGSSGNRLIEQILQFAAERPDIEINIRSNNNHPKDYSPWIYGREGSGEQPDIIELTPTQMKLWFHHGKLEPLNLVEPQYRDYTISSPDGYIIGLKSKINPLIVYYNQDIFTRLGLEAPSSDWDWSKLDDTIVRLKAAGENVYVMISPAILEWVTMNRYDGHIVDSSSTVFSGYIDSEEAVQAAEWLSWIGTKDEDYKERKFGSSTTHTPMPYDLIEDNMALAIDFAFALQTTGITNFEDIIQQNHQVSVATVPGRSGGVNIAKMSGLSIRAESQNKEIAMELIRYLAQDSDQFFLDTIQHTYDAYGGEDLMHDAARTVLLYEAKRSIPASLYMYEGQNHGDNDAYFQPRRPILQGQPAKDVLANEAGDIDFQFEMFKEAMENYISCIQQFSGVCGR